MNDPYPSLHQTVRVAADGAVTHGMFVPHRAANIKVAENRIVAAARRTVHSPRFAPDRMPAGVDVNATLPHDCRNHLREFESQVAEDARLALDGPPLAEVAA